MKVADTPSRTGAGRLENSAAPGIRSDSSDGRDNSRTPLLSVLCITYNHEKYIAQALDSFLMQETTFPVEIVVGEDCSSDNTLSVVEGYRNKFPEIIKVIASQSNGGAVENFRRTLKACKGKYIAICEGDDYWTDNQKLQIQVEFLEANPDYVISYHDAYAFDELGILVNPQLPRDLQCDATAGELLDARQISTLTACFRNVLSEIPPEFDRSPILDLCLWSLLGNYGKGKYLRAIKPAAYRVHGGGILSSQNDANKCRMTIHTYLCLSRFYARVGNEEASQRFAFKTTLMASSQLSTLEKIRLLATLVDGLLGNPLYMFKKLLTGK